MEEIYKGKKVYYLNKYYQVIFAEIIDVFSDTVLIKNEYGRKFEVLTNTIKNNKINEQPKKSDIYLKCRCGNMYFLNFDGKLICKNCNSEYSKEDLELLETTEYELPLNFKVEVSALLN